MAARQICFRVGERQVLPAHPSYCRNRKAGSADRRVSCPPVQTLRTLMFRVPMALRCRDRLPSSSKCRVMRPFRLGVSHPISSFSPIVRAAALPARCVSSRKGAHASRLTPPKWLRKRTTRYRRPLPLYPRRHDLLFDLCIGSELPVLRPQRGSDRSRNFAGRRGNPCRSFDRIDCRLVPAGSRKYPRFWFVRPPSEGSLFRNRSDRHL